MMVAVLILVSVAILLPSALAVLTWRMTCRVLSFHRYL